MDAVDWELAYQRAQAMAATQAGFLGRASHELRAPFNHIISLHQLILEGLCDDPAEERLFLAQAFDATQTVLKNLDLLIAVSKLEIGQTQPVVLPLPLGMMMAGVEELTTPGIKNRNCRLTLGALPADLLVESDHDWLQQALVLLVEAAIAAESQSLSIQGQALDEATVELIFQTDSPCDRWQGPEGAESQTGESQTGEWPGSLPPQPQPTRLSPGFSLELVNRIVAVLGGTVQAGAGINPSHQAIQIHLPRSPHS